MKVGKDISAQILIEALPCIQKFNNKIIVIKYGGNAMVDEHLKKAVMRDLVLLNIVGIKVVLVHGGGPEIDQMLNRLSIEARFINGLRYTDEDTSDIVQMVLAGKVNKQLVSLIHQNGGKGIGMCGSDGNMLTVEKLVSNDDLGFVGDIKSVNISPIMMALDNGYIPIIATVGTDENGQVYNINADTAAAAIAGALKAKKLITMTDVIGLLKEKDNEESLISSVNISEIPELIEKQIIVGGMVPKVESCVEAIKQGVKEATIIDGRIEHSILIELFSNEGIGTLFHKNWKGIRIRKVYKMEKTKADILKKQDEKYIGGTYKRSDLCLAEGSKASVKDLEGKEYIDFSSGIGVNSFGFSDEGWVRAITGQACKLQHTSNLYYTEPAVKVARLLVEKSKMSKVFFANSGAEANECAIKTVRKYGNEKYGQHRNEIITLKNSFHGRTMATITATGQEEYHHFFHPFSEGFLYVEPNQIEELEQTVSENTCAIMIELIQGEGGVNTLDREYVDNISRICIEKDILLIVDEVQTGVGRTGTTFAFEQFNIQPDLVTVAKGLGGGLPIGAVIFNKKTENILTFGDHGTTFGGNLIVCAGAAYILESLDKKMLAEINKKSEYIRKELLEMDGVEIVSGLGLMIGIKHKTKTAKEVAEACLQEGLIVLTAKEKVRLLPPLNISWEQLEKGLDILKKVLKG